MRMPKVIDLSAEERFNYSDMDKMLRGRMDCTIIVSKRAWDVSIIHLYKYQRDYINWLIKSKNITLTKK